MAVIKNLRNVAKSEYYKQVVLVDFKTFTGRKKENVIKKKALLHFFRHT